MIGRGCVAAEEILLEKISLRALALLFTPSGKVFCDRAERTKAKLQKAQ